MIIIGNSGIGKTTIGERFSYRRNLRFTDTDRLVELWCKGRSCAQIRSEDGDMYFRSMERAALCVALKRDGVIATGSDILQRDDNVEDIKACGAVRPVIYLYGNIQTLVQRREMCDPLAYLHISATSQRDLDRHQKYMLVASKVLDMNKSNSVTESVKMLEEVVDFGTDDRIFALADALENM